MSRKTENVDVGFNSIVEAANEYRGFILGMPAGDVISAILGSQAENKEEESVALLEQQGIRNVLSDITDRTNGGCSMSDIQYVADDKWQANDVISAIPHESIITTFHRNPKAAASNDFTYSGFDPISGSALGDSWNDYLAGNISHVVSYINPKNFSDRSVQDIPKSNPSGDNTSEQTDSEGNDETVRVVSLGEISGSQIILDQRPPATFNMGEGNNFSKTMPSLGAVVIKDPRHGFNSRSANHLPVFLSAITPIEMSRCTPYLDVKILTRQRTSYNKMGIHNFIRVSESEKSNGDSAFFNPTPASADPLVENSIDGSMVNYMDLFTSPQTMVNANINKEWFGEELSDIKDSFSQFKKDEGVRTSSEYSFSKVTDPLQPFMTLLGFNISVSGVGHGLLATKKANMKIKLHDKSRIKDISSLLSPKEFGSTRFIVEFGWSHPDSDITSTNTLGKYLNALRDAGTYQLVNADYSFGDDNSVDITLNLVCSGFSQLTSVSAAGGKLTGLNTIMDDLEEVIDKYIEENVEFKEGDNRKKRIKEIRGTLKINKGSLSKNSILIPFERIANWNDYLKNNFVVRRSVSDNSLGVTITESKVDFLSALYNLIYGINEDFVDINTLLENEEDRNIAFSVIESESVNAGDVIVAKLKSLPYGVDPFRGQCSRNSWEYLELANYGFPIESFNLIGSFKDGLSYEKAENKFVSLGKIISSFIGYPLSTCGLYDEVQLFFYPVNSHSAGARKHTTASLPIKISDLEEQIKKRILASEQSFRDLSVRGFFSMLERIVSNITIPAYGIYTPNDGSFYNALQEFREAEITEKLKILRADTSYGGESAVIEQVAEDIAAGVSSETISESEAEKIKKELEEDRLIQSYDLFLSKKIEGEKDRKIQKIYEQESIYIDEKYTDNKKFVPINLSLFFETFPVRDKAFEETVGQDSFLDILKDTFIKGDRRELDSKGIDYGKTCLRIHIYDENTVTNPDNSLYGTDFRNSVPSEDSSLSDLNSYDFVKHKLMQYHPTIIHGSSSGVVNSIRVSSNTASPLSNILLVESYGQTLEDSDDSDAGDGFDETVLLPTTVNLEMMGFPMLSRGQQIFIDFGTGTSLDNLYMVKTVDHTIEAGMFKTSAILTAANQMIVTSFKNRIEDIFESVTGT